MYIGMFYIEFKNKTRALALLNMFKLEIRVCTKAKICQTDLFYSNA